MKSNLTVKPIKRSIMLIGYENFYERCKKVISRIKVTPEVIIGLSVVLADRVDLFGLTNNNLSFKLNANKNFL